MEIIIEYFLLAMFLMFVYLYLNQPKPKIIIKEPNIQTSVSSTYVDDNNIFYKYHRKEVSCSK
jgi:hypothetical protein